MSCKAASSLCHSPFISPCLRVLVLTAFDDELLHGPVSETNLLLPKLLLVMVFYRSYRKHQDKYKGNKEDRGHITKEDFPKQSIFELDCVINSNKHG